MLIGWALSRDLAPPIRMQVSLELRTFLRIISFLDLLWMTIRDLSTTYSNICASVSGRLAVNFPTKRDRRPSLKVPRSVWVQQLCSSGRHCRQVPKNNNGSIKGHTWSMRRTSCPWSGKHAIRHTKYDNTTAHDLLAKYSSRLYMFPKKCHKMGTGSRPSTFFCYNGSL